MAATDPRPWLLAVLLLAGCPDNGVSDDDDVVLPEPSPWVLPDDDDVAEDPAPELPEGMELPGGSLFEVNTTRSVFAIPIPGDPDHELTGRLADRQGRREIRYGQLGLADEVLAAADWVMPPVAAVQPDGTTAVCYSVLTGNTSPLTEGDLPDPTQGVTLNCVVGSSGSWSAPIRLGDHNIAAWLTAIEPQGDGSFRVVYWSDGGLLVMPTSDQDGSYAQQIVEGQAGPVEVIELVDPDLLEVGDPGDPGN